MGRRILAITLLIAFGSPLVAPVFAATADPQSSLPACCRRHGTHHCTMLMPAANNGPAFQAPPCPFFPTATTPLRIAATSLTTPLRLTVEQLRSPAPLHASPHRAQTIAASANLKRGPPAPLLKGC
jgi:hypothetical protein